MRLFENISHQFIFYYKGLILWWNGVRFRSARSLRHVTIWNVVNRDVTHYFKSYQTDFKTKLVYNPISLSWFKRTKAYKTHIKWMSEEEAVLLSILLIKKNNSWLSYRRLDQLVLKLYHTFWYRKVSLSDGLWNFFFINAITVLALKL